MTISNVSIARELKTDFLSYSLAIFNRALPSAVDGLKTAQRRIVLGLKDLNLRPNGAFKKVSRLEGHVLGLYHPQGGCAGTAINMGQASGFRYPLTNIHGNVGGSIQSGPSVGQSISEDPPAAARYLEIKLTDFTQLALVDEIDKQACEWRPNYDDSTKEIVEIVPILPTLLVNGAQGIASGYACHHVSYNLKEVLKATKAFIKNKTISSKALFSHFTCPDLPNGARILNNEELFKAFDTGQGVLKLFGTWEFTRVDYKKKSKRWAIIVTSLASGSSEKFLEKVKEGLEAGKINGIADIADHSSRSGIRIEVILKSSIQPKEVLSELLAYTNLHDTLNVNATALAKGLPTVFGVKDLIKEWYEARCSMLHKRYTHEISELEKQIHILEGLLIVLADIDNVVKLIKSSKNRPEAREKLQKSYNLSETQANAVLDMTLSRLVNTETLELKSKKAELEAKIAKLQGILNNPDQMDDHIIEQMAIFKPMLDQNRSVLITQQDVGVEKAKNNIVRRRTSTKLPSIKDKIKAEAKKLGIKRANLKAFLEKNVGSGNLKGAWEEFKKAQAHEASLHTRKGRAERREILNGLKEAAQNRGMPKRGQHGWNAFMAGRESATIDEIEKALEIWLKNLK